MFDQYEALPDYMKPEEIAGKRTEFLGEVQTTNVDVEDASAALCVLADRQWHTYEYLHSTLKSPVDDWVATAWNSLNLRQTHGLPDWLAKERLRIVESLASAIGMLGLSKSYQVLKGSLADDMYPDIRTEIERTVAEFGDTVDDPFKGMKELGGSDH